MQKKSFMWFFLLHFYNFEMNLIVKGKNYYKIICKNINLIIKIYINLINKSLMVLVLININN